jgi:hypothetical protein
MFVQQDISFIRDSERAADLILSANNLYTTIKNICGKIFGAFLILLLGIPVILFIWVVLSILVWRIKKHYNTEIIISIQNYKELKGNQQRLNKVSKSLTGLKDMNIKEVPFVFKGIMRKIRKLFILVDRYRTALNTKISSLNSNVTNGNFKPVNEDQLWKSRTQVYEYLA